MRCLTAMPLDLKEVSLFFVSYCRYFSKSNTHRYIFQGCWKAPANWFAWSMVPPGTELEYQVSFGFLRTSWRYSRYVDWRPISSLPPWARWKYAWNRELAVCPMLLLDNKRWLATTQPWSLFDSLRISSTGQLTVQYSALCPSRRLLDSRKLSHQWTDWYFWTKPSLLVKSIPTISDLCWRSRRGFAKHHN